MQKHERILTGVLPLDLLNISAVISKHGIWWHKIQVTLPKYPSLFVTRLLFICSFFMRIGVILLPQLAPITFNSFLPGMPSHSIHSILANVLIK